MAIDVQLMRRLVLALEKIPGAETFNLRTKLLQDVRLSVTRSESSARVDLLGVVSDLSKADPPSLLLLIDNASFMSTSGEVVDELAAIRAAVADALANRSRVSSALATTVAAPFEKVVTALGIHDLGWWTARLLALQGQVARISLRNIAQGTGFLVGPDVLLTNHHVMEAALKGLAGPADYRVHFEYHRDGQGKIQDPVDVDLATDWRLADSPPSDADWSSDLTRLPTTDELDYALVRLARPIGAEPRGAAKRGWVTVPSTPPEITPGMQLFILQHPDGQPLRLGIDVVERVNGNRTRVRYRTNTKGGSSGSPCLDQHWNLLALHHASGPEETDRYNQGVPVATIREHLARQGKLELLGV